MTHLCAELPTSNQRARDRSEWPRRLSVGSKSEKRNHANPIAPQETNLKKKKRHLALLWRHRGTEEKSQDREKFSGNGGRGEDGVQTRRKITEERQRGAKKC